MPDSCFELTVFTGGITNCRISTSNGLSDPNSCSCVRCSSGFFWDGTTCASCLSLHFSISVSSSSNFMLFDAATHLNVTGGFADCLTQISDGHQQGSCACATCQSGFFQAADGSCSACLRIFDGYDHSTLSSGDVDACHIIRSDGIYASSCACEFCVSGFFYSDGACNSCSCKCYQCMICCHGQCRCHLAVSLEHFERV